jgi:beta-galactosidase
MWRFLLVVAIALPLSAQRTRVTINDDWRFAPGAIEGAERVEFDDGKWDRVHLPHTWNAGDAFDKTRPYRRGIGWYRRPLVLGPEQRDKRLFLYFEGANQVADVYVNGKLAGTHSGGYTAFVFDITDYVTLDRRNVVAVRVDNSHNPDIPPLNADFTFYGGIYRDVWLIATSPIHVTLTDHASPGVFISTPEVSAARAVVRITGTIMNATDRSARLRVMNRILDAAGAEVAVVGSNVRVEAGSSATFDQQTAVASPRLWSPDSPNVYRVRTEVLDGVELADTTDNPLGFRWFRADPHRGFFLNGLPFPLRGTNRHHDYPGLGNALSDDLHRRDLRLVKENGFNFLRLAHYPQDPAVLREADRLGLVLWEEIPIVNLISTSPRFAENSERMLVEMIRQHFNHPSVVFWGYMNEVLLTRPDPLPAQYYDRVNTLAWQLERRARAEDPDRLTAMALSRDEILDDKDLGNVSRVLGLNLYFGWYYETFADFGPFLDRIHRERPSRPLIVSEYGAGTDERVHAGQPKALDFSSEYGQIFHTESFPQIEARPYLTGSAVWNQFDFSSASRQDTRFGLNNKGLFFYNRTPKDAVFYYQAALLEKPVLYIAREWTERAGSRPEDRLQPVWVYTNQPEVELFVGGRSAGTRPVENRMARWTVELANGANSIRARAGSFEDRVTIFYTDRFAGTSFAVNAGGTYSYTDEAHVVWESDRGYSGGESHRTHHRIFGTSDDPLFQASREGMERYRFDVPDGVYEVTLGFAEGRGDVPSGGRIFSVAVNGVEAVRDLDLVAGHGRYTAVTRSVVVEATDGRGISIDFTARAGKASVASIMVRRQ